MSDAYPSSPEVEEPEHKKQKLPPGIPRQIEDTEVKCDVRMKDGKESHHLSIRCPFADTFHAVEVGKLPCQKFHKYNPKDPLEAVAFLGSWSRQAGNAAYNTRQRHVHKCNPKKADVDAYKAEMAGL